MVGQLKQSGARRSSGGRDRAGRTSVPATSSGSDSDAPPSSKRGGMSALRKHGTKRRSGSSSSSSAGKSGGGGGDGRGDRSGSRSSSKRGGRSSGRSSSKPPAADTDSSDVSSSDTSEDESAAKAATAKAAKAKAKKASDAPKDAPKAAAKAGAGSKAAAAAAADGKKAKAPAGKGNSDGDSSSSSSSSSSDEDSSSDNGRSKVARRILNDEEGVGSGGGAAAVGDTSFARARRGGAGARRASTDAAVQAAGWCQRTCSKLALSLGLSAKLRTPGEKRIEPLTGAQRTRIADGLDAVLGAGTGAAVRGREGSDDGDSEEEEEEEEEDGEEGGGESGGRGKKTRKAKAKAAVAAAAAAAAAGSSHGLSVFVSHADELEDDPLVTHPFVRVHVVDASTGRYLFKSDATRPATTFHEACASVPPAPAPVLAGAMGSGLPGSPTPPGTPAPPLARHGHAKNCEHIGPISTAPAALGPSKRRPMWREQLLFAEPFAAVLANPRALLLIEVVDFGPALPVEKLKAAGGVYGVAWGFLRPCGAFLRDHMPVQRAGLNLSGGGGGGGGGATEGGRGGGGGGGGSGGGGGGGAASTQPLRLQLHRYAKMTAAQQQQARTMGLCAGYPPVPPVFLQYLRGPTAWLGASSKLPCSIAVRVQAVPLPRRATVGRRPRHPLEVERFPLQLGGLTDEALPGGLAEMGGMGEDGEEEDGEGGGGGGGRQGAEMRRERRKREPLDRCRPPSTLVHRLGLSRGATATACGAFAIKFSPSGALLAVSCVEDGGRFPVRVFDVASGARRQELSGHQGLVYELCWGRDDTQLYSCSADGTARVWNVVPKEGMENLFDAVGSPYKGQKPVPVPGGGGGGEQEEEPQDDEAEAGEGGDEEQTTRGRANTNAPAPVGHRDERTLLMHVPPCPIYTICTFWDRRAPSAAAAAAGGAVGGSEAADGTDGVVLLTGARDGTLRAWDRNTGDPLGDPALRGKLDKGRQHHRAPINAVVADCQRGRVYSGDGAGEVKIWTPKKGARDPSR